jgi:subtilisin family serine protease
VPRNLRTASIIVALTLAGFGVRHAPAQLPVQVPVPQVELPGTPVGDVVRGVGQRLDTLRDVRLTRVATLAREHRTELDRDPQGELVVRAEVVAVGIAKEALQRALAEDFQVKRVQTLAALDLEITTLATPPGWSARRGLKRLRKLDPLGTYDYNHVYLDSATADLPRATARARSLDASAQVGGSALRVGLIDGGVDTTHAALAGNVVHRSGCNGDAVPSAHGTAVASLLAGDTAEFHGAAPRAEIFAADVYCGLATGGAVDAVSAGLGWLARERIAVINVSLVGPRNALLERVIKLLVARGHLVVAAVGNDGPAAEPLYPAAYEGVIAVTAVDRSRRVLFEAGRGKHVDFAAPGADLGAAQAGTREGFAPVRGTSFAAPLVAGLLARELGAPDPVRSTRVIAELAERAVDLGARGPDSVYGAGLVAADFAGIAPKTK